MAQISELNVVMDDGFTLSILGGLVSASTPPGNSQLTMTTPGSAGEVDETNQFDQLMNESTSSGIVTITDPFNLAGGSQTIDLSTLPPSMFDMLDVQLTAVDDQLTVAASFNIEIPLDNGLTLNSAGSIVATGTLPNEVTITVTPTVLTRSRGVIVSGEIDELEFSDNEDVSMRRNPTGVVSITEFEVTGNSSVASPTAFQFTLESSVFARTEVNQSISLFDFDLGDWELIDERPASRFSDATTVALATAGDLSRFVDTNGDIRARVTHLSANPRQQFASNSDHAFWTITGN